LLDAARSREWLDRGGRLTPTEDGYEVADVPPLDPVYARGTADELVKILFRIEERPSLKAG
jgi:hypothetical protein